MKKLLPFLFLLLLLTACTTKSPTDNTTENNTTEDISSVIDETIYDVETSSVDIKNTLSIDNVLFRKEITTEDIISNGHILFSEIAFGSTVEDVLKKWQLSEQELVNLDGPNSNVIFTDKVIYTLNGYDYFPYINLWNGEVNIVYLISVDNKGKEDQVRLFENIIGDSNTSYNNYYWEVLQVRLSIGDNISLPDIDNNYSIAIQKITA